MKEKERNIDGNTTNLVHAMQAERKQETLYSGWIIKTHCRKRMGKENKKNATELRLRS